MLLLIYFSPFSCLDRDTRAVMPRGACKIFSPVNLSYHLSERWWTFKSLFALPGVSSCIGCDRLYGRKWMECTFQGPPTASRHGCASCTVVESEGASRSFPVLLLLRHHLPSARRGKEVQETEFDAMVQAMCCQIRTLRGSIQCSKPKIKHSYWAL